MNKRRMTLKIKPSLRPSGRNVDNRAVPLTLRQHISRKYVAMLRLAAGSMKLRVASGIHASVKRASREEWMRARTCTVCGSASRRGALGSSGPKN